MTKKQLTQAEINKLQTIACKIEDLQNDISDRNSRSMDTNLKRDLLDMSLKCSELIRNYSDITF